MLHLWHFTCDHVALVIGDRGQLRPAKDLAEPDSFWALAAWPSSFVWATDLPKPNRDALGLTSNMLACDRTAHRYRVLAEDFTPWHVIRRLIVDRHGRLGVELLEGAPGARPMHWFVSTEPVEAVYDPLVTT